MRGLSSSGIAWRAAQDIPNGAVVNLGIGLPERVANFIPSDREVLIHSENGILGMGPAPAPSMEDFELINAGKKPVTLLPGGSFFDHADSFALVRGGHIDICILGAFQVSATGDLANWMNEAPGTAPAVGGAMDLAQGARNIFVIMTHTTRDGRPKLLDCCTLPLTGAGVVRRIFTELAVIDIGKTGFVVTDIAEHVDPAALQRLTGAPLAFARDLRPLKAPV
ncbi:MAG: 3-oxoacid CoA-transferase subunit B [Hyphomonadaceae bacterium]